MPLTKMGTTEAEIDRRVYRPDSSVRDKLELMERVAGEVWYSGEKLGLKIKI